MNIHDFCEGLKKHFPGIDPNKMLDKRFLATFNEVAIDIIALDDWLHDNEKYCEDKSIRSNVESMYGIDAVNFVESLI